MPVEITQQESNSTASTQTPEESPHPQFTKSCAKSMNTKNFINNQLTMLSNIWRSSTESVDQILDDLGAYVVLDSVAKKLARHPFLAFGLSAAFLSITLPFIVFMMFTIVTVMMTFTGFVIVEGTLITVASVFLFGFLGTVVVVFFVFGAVFLTGYFGFLHIYDRFCPGPKSNVHFTMPNGQQRQVRLTEGGQ